VCSLVPTGDSSALRRSTLADCGKTRPRRGSGDPDHRTSGQVLTSPHVLCFHRQHGDVPMKSGQVPSPLHVFPQPVRGDASNKPRSRSWPCPCVSTPLISREKAFVEPFNFGIGVKQAADKLVGAVILRSRRRQRISYVHENAQSEILRFAQNDSREAFFRSL